MSEWHGYEQHKDAHPERPWWREVTAMTQYWVRTDGLTTTSAASLEAYDRCKPLPPPPPKCGQVWVDLKYKTQSMCCGVGPDGAAGWFPDAGGGTRPPTWPPPGAVLVAGPHSPWASE